MHLIPLYTCSKAACVRGASKAPRVRPARSLFGVD
jgi:hypothetical protein